MNVQEQLLREKIDPHLTDANLTELAARALDGGSDGAGGGPPAEGAALAGAPAPDVRGYRVLTGGCWNRVIGVTAGDGSPGGRPLVYKISPHEQDARILREFQVLRAFAEPDALRVPTPLWCDDGRILPGTTLVMTRIPGVVMHQCYGMLTPEQQATVTDQIAGDLAALHNRRSTGFGGVEFTPDERSPTWAEFWLPRYDKALEDAAASDAVPPPLVDAARSVRDEFVPFLNIGPESTMTHYDIWSGNVMIDLHADPPGVSGYIDVPGFYADYARELSFAMMFGVADHRFFQRYLEHHDIDHGFSVRAAIYNLKMNIKHVMMYPDQYYYQQAAAECLEVIRRAVGG
jgi:fructosamine-3-kinase